MEVAYNACTLGRRRQMRRITLIVWFVVLTVQPCGEPRPVNFLSHEESLEKADAVVLLSVINIDLSNENPEDYNIAQSYQAYKAHCSVISTFKGTLKGEVSLLFFQHPIGMPGFNGVIPAPFYEELTIDAAYRRKYLAYLKRNPEALDEFIPVSGHQDAGASIFALTKPETIQIQLLCPHFSVIQPKDAFGKPIDRTEETQSNVRGVWK